jgi:cyclopropane-fatty-acyl-phospholipid synthase
MSTDGLPIAKAGASPQAIESHYGVGDEFFNLWLGPEMVYSCAMFDAAQDLDAAQLRKLDYHIEAAGAAGASRVLDIGCGWGALLRRLVTHAGVKQAVGLTLSSSQAVWARRAGGPGIDVRIEDWRDHKPESPYDAIISIGAFEHFVHPGMDPVEKLDAYREFFAWCHRALATGGKLSLQTIAFTKPPSQSLQEQFMFLSREVFPESQLPLIWEPLAAAEGLFEIMALRNDAADYVRTLRHWEENLQARSAEAISIVGETTFENFRRYLMLSGVGFIARIVCLLRMTFVKSAGS